MRKALEYRCRAPGYPEPRWAIFSWSVNYRIYLKNTLYLLLVFLYVPLIFCSFGVFFFFTPRVLSITRMHSKQRHAVVRDPLAAGEQQEAYRWAPCPRKTKIARWQTGLQCISRPVLRQWWQWAVTGEAWSELATQKGKTLQFAAHYSSINSMITSKSHDHQNQTGC